MAPEEDGLPEMRTRSTIVNTRLPPPLMEFLDNLTSKTGKDEKSYFVRFALTLLEAKFNQKRVIKNGKTDHTLTIRRIYEEDIQAVIVEDIPKRPKRVPAVKMVEEEAAQ